MAIFITLDASGMDDFADSLESYLRASRSRVLRRSQVLLAQSVDQAFLSRGYSATALTGPTLNGSEPKREKGGRWKKHRPSTVRSREIWARQNGPPAGDELRLTDALRRAATDTTGTTSGSAAYVDDAGGEAAIGVELSRFPGAAALQWGYAPRNLAARPFLGLTTTTERLIKAEGQKELENVAQEVSRRFNR